jgi:CubicO group peptidase (beta-lactamase class C family)
MRPLLRFFKDWLLSKKVLGNDPFLEGMVGADTLLKELIAKEKVPGLAIVVIREGETIFQKGYGYANLESKMAVHPKETIFRIASISKNIAAVGLAQMVVEGLIDLDASFYKYVPYFPKKEWDFTIRQLAGHTAGIRGYRGKEYGLNKPMTIKEGISIFKEDPLVYEPGTDYLYTSFGWNLIALAMEEVSGMPLETYVRQKVLEPLQMNNTYAPREMVAGQLENRATFYSKTGKTFRRAIPVDNAYKLAGGGYLSTAADISKFGSSLLQGNLLPNETFTAFLTQGKVNGKSTYYGLGWQVSEDTKGRLFYGHVGNGVGGYSNLFVYPKQKMVFSILVNCTDPKVQHVLDQVVNLLLTSK